MLIELFRDLLLFWQSLLVNLFITETSLQALPQQLFHPSQKDLILAKPKSWLMLSLLLLLSAPFQAATETARTGCYDDIRPFYCIAMTFLIYSISSCYAARQCQCSNSADCLQQYYFLLCLQVIIMFVCFLLSLTERSEHVVSHRTAPLGISVSCLITLKLGRGFSNLGVSHK